MSRAVTVQHLKQVPLFASLTKRDLNAIAAAGSEVSRPAGHRLLAEGDHGDVGYVVLTGEVSVTRKGRKIATLGPGEILGELSLLGQEARTASVDCVTDCTLLHLEGKSFIKLLEQSPNLMHKLLQTLAGRVRELDRTIYG
jgi:CRP/FNR family transcriptional regulator, cyclic AMP receptor protein